MHKWHNASADHVAFSRIPTNSPDFLITSLAAAEVIGKILCASLISFFLTYSFKRLAILRGMKTASIQVSLPGLEFAGIDVFEEGNHLADYTYNSREECLEDLSKTVWIYLEPKEDWTEDKIRYYDRPRIGFQRSYTRTGSTRRKFIKNGVTYTILNC